MKNDKRFEHNGPCRVSESQLECSEYFCDTCFAGVSGHEDMFNVLGFGSCELFARES
jgi:hypothetical protein